MIIKAIWISVMFLVTVWAIFSASFGVKIQEAFYSKTEIMVANHDEF